MPRRCPPGVICFENVTIVILVLLLLAVLWYIGSVAYAKGVSYTQPQPQPPPATSAVFMPTMTSALSIPSPQRSNDVLLDLYQPPLRDDRYFIRDEYDIMSRMLPPQPSLTRRRQDTEYRQVGILTPKHHSKGGSGSGSGSDSTTILPLMGRPLLTNRDKWNFYTMNDKNNMIKLPLRVNGKSGTSEYGCDDVSTGDAVFVEGYKEAFSVTAYDSDSMRYLP